jgi:hypothetical protein
VASYTLSQSITAAQLADADDADALIAATEADVIGQLGGERKTEPVKGEEDTPRGDTELAWYAITPGIEGSGIEEGEPGADRPATSVDWNPTTDEVPEGAEILVCHGERTA